MEPNVKPIFCKPTPVPFAHRENVERQIDKFVEEGLISPTDSAEWVTPLVPILKTDGILHICGNYKRTINSSLKEVNYPIPRVDDIFDKLRGGEQFSKLDLKSAYSQLEMDEVSKQYLTWSTHKGIYKVHRLPFGIKPATGIFQAEIDKLIQGIPGTVSFLDDITITGKNREEHLKSLKEVFTRLENAGFRLNEKKCLFF